MNLTIRDGWLCLENGIVRGNLTIRDGIITEVGEDAPVDNEQVIEATGCYVAPGFIDFHVHLNDQIGPYRLADDWTSGSSVALINGITTLINFITQKPDQSLPQAIEGAMSAAKNRSYCDYHWHLTPTQISDTIWMDLETWIDRGFRTIKLYTTYRKAGIFSDYTQIETCFRRLRSKPVTFLIHCEDDDILSATKVENGLLSSAYAHALLRPPEAEIVAIRRCTDLAAKHQVPLHVVHVSTTDGAMFIAEKKKQMPISSETCPQYLFFSEEKLKSEEGMYYICSPPLRSEQNRQRMMELAQIGIFDVFATDHCPFLISDKKGCDPGDIRTVPNGIPGLGALIPLIFKLERYKLPEGICDAVRRLSTHPARIAGFYPRKGTLKKGSDGDVVIFKINGTARPVRSTFKDVWDPYSGMTSPVDIQYVFLRGRMMVQNGQFCQSSQPEGQWIWNV